LSNITLGGVGVEEEVEGMDEEEEVEEEEGSKEVCPMRFVPWDLQDLSLDH
jgi:hypothetical protein